LDGQREQSRLAQRVYRESERNVQMTDFEKYELHVELCQIANDGYFINYAEWLELKQNAEKELAKYESESYQSLKQSSL
jgi:hypothetical protein